jgi:hypothetical protein
MMRERAAAAALTLLTAGALVATAAPGRSADDAGVGATQSAPQASSSPPRLLVLVVIDQLRADYLDQYGTQWTHGLRRLIDGGAVFTRATYPYAATRTCAGHSSIGTGTVPATHGMIDNEWFDPSVPGFVACTSDAMASPVPFAGGRGAERHSAARLEAPTLSDELRRQQPRARVVSVALKARAAISLGGRGGSNAMVIWEEDSGTWATSSAYAHEPWPEVDAFIRANPPTADRGRAWDRLLPAAMYRYDDTAPGEPRGSAFPHELIPPAGVPFAAVWDMSPFSDAYLAALAGSLVERLRLGASTSSTDMLAIGFSALDYVGHSYGPRSHEVQDVLVRLDRALGQLLATLDRVAGRDNYVVALSSDHGVAPLPEQAPAGEPGGRVDLNLLGRAIETTLAAELGRRRSVHAITSTYVHFLPGVMDVLTARPALFDAVAAAAKTVPGIEHVYWARDLTATQPTSNATLMGLRKSYVRGRSGDLAFLPRRHWVVASGGTTHGTMHDYDTQVPMVFYGRGIRPGRFTTGGTPLDIAPTLGALAGVTLPRAEGQVLTHILAR